MSTIIGQNLQYCLFSEYEYICPSRWLSSTYKFLGSIGCLTEGCGIRAALGNVYAPITVRHMFSGKGFVPAIRGHILCASGILPLLFGKFWDDISLEEKNQLAKDFELCNHKIAETNDSVRNLAS